MQANRTSRRDAEARLLIPVGLRLVPLRMFEKGFSGQTIQFAAKRVPLNRPVKAIRFKFLELGSKFRKLVRRQPFYCAFDFFYGCRGL